MKKHTVLILVFIIFSFYCRGQDVRLTFSPSITNSQDSSVKAIAQLWNDYLNSIQTKQSDSIQKSFWYNELDDLLKYWTIGTISYEFGEQFTFSIRKYSDNIYEIHSLYLFPPESRMFDIMRMYKVCATKTNGEFKLLNYFDVYKHSLQNHNSDNVEFYYPCGFNFDIEKANNAAKFILQFQNDYNVKNSKEKIIYLIGNSLTESNSFMGFDFSTATSENKNAGYFLYPRIVFTCRPDHIHEFVHAIMIPEYPDALGILHEGIATYYGGIAGQDYVFHRNNLKNYVNKNSIDFSEPSIFYTINIGNNTILYKMVGALMIEYALTNYGIHKVVELFSCKNYEDIFSKLGIKIDDVNNFFILLINEKL